MSKRFEQSCHAKLLRLVAGLLTSLGFRRGKSSCFTRQQGWVIEFIHLHKYFAVPSYKIHLGIRVLNDVFPALALNGPDSHTYTSVNSPSGSRYVLDISPEDPVEVCAAEIHRWCLEVGLPWFDRYRDPYSLLTHSDSPLRESERTRLQLAMDGESDWAAVEASEALLGITDRYRLAADKKNQVVGVNSTSVPPTPGPRRKRLRGPRIREMEQRLDELEKRLRALESK
jgi:hypothetical protein